MQLTNTEVKTIIELMEHSKKELEMLQSFIAKLKDRQAGIRRYGVWIPRGKYAQASEMRFVMNQFMIEHEVHSDASGYTFIIPASELGKLPKADYDRFHLIEDQETHES